MKSQKTCLVSTNSTRRVHGLTPRFSSVPSVLNLRNDERIVGAEQGGQYLVRKRQDVVVVIEELQGPRVVLGEGVTVETLTRSRISIPWLPSCERRYLSLGQTRERGRNIPIISD